MKKTASIAGAKKSNGNSLLTSAKNLLRGKGFGITSIEKAATKTPFEPLAYKPKGALTLLQSNRKRRLEAFAVVYAHYLILENHPALDAMVRRCVAQQGMTRVTEGVIPSAVLRCIMGYKMETTEIRANQRQHINPVARAIARLKKKGITPEAVAAMTPGNGNSIRAWAAAYGDVTAKPSSKKNHTVNLPKLGIVTMPGGQVILLGQGRGPDRVEVTDWASLGKTGAEKTWKRIEELARKNYSAQ
jgi:hypothetical protein